jgi:hypothetical protein
MTPADIDIEEMHALRVLKTERVRYDNEQSKQQNRK